MAELHQLGKSGEELALRHLKKKGYEILETNWRKGTLEVDIIASINQTLVIAEVKARSTAFFGEPEEFVTKAKQKNMIKAANLYIEQNNLSFETRFDIISVLFKGSQHKVHHIEDAFYPTI
jgi:putative endonuclease